MIAAPHLEDLRAFAAHASLREELVGYVRGCRARFLELWESREGNPELLEKWFCYWPKGYLDFSRDVPRVSVIEMHFDGASAMLPNVEWARTYRPSDPAAVPAFELDMARLESTRDTSWGLVKELTDALRTVPRPPEVSDVVLTVDDDGLLLQIGFKENLHPEPWEEGSPGFQL
jgi:hypothetical protein